jgi:hypothetical protein
MAQHMASRPLGTAGRSAGSKSLPPSSCCLDGQVPSWRYCRRSGGSPAGRARSRDAGTRALTPVERSAGGGQRHARRRSEPGLRLTDPRESNRLVERDGLRIRHHVDSRHAALARDPHRVLDESATNACSHPIRLDEQPSSSHASPQRSSRTAKPTTAPFCSATRTRPPVICSIGSSIASGRAASCARYIGSCTEERRWSRSSAPRSATDAGRMVVE